MPSPFARKQTNELTLGREDLSLEQGAGQRSPDVPANPICLVWQEQPAGFTDRKSIMLVPGALRMHKRGADPRFSIYTCGDWALRGKRAIARDLVALPPPFMALQ